MPRFRMGLMIGLAVGYYQGTKAGHARYEQLRTYVDKVSRTEAVETAREKARAVIDLSVERAKDFTGNGDGDGASGDLPGTPSTVIDERLTTATVTTSPSGYSSSR